MFIGVEGGPTFNNLSTHVLNESYTVNDRGTGYTIGINSKYNFIGRLWIQAGINLFQKNYSTIRTGPYSGIYESFKNNYIQLPIEAQLRLGSKSFHYYVGAGLYAGYWIAARTKGADAAILNLYDSLAPGGQIEEYFRLINYDDKYHFDPRRDQRWEFGWHADVGMEYLFDKKISIFSEFRYYQSAVDQQKHYQEEQISRYNKSFSIIMGCQIGLSLKKGFKYIKNE